MSALLGLALALPFLFVPSVTTYAQSNAPAAGSPSALAPVATTTARQVPFFSQFSDIAEPRWQKVGCGITDLAMVVDYYHPKAATVEALLKTGVAAGAYDYSAGWIYQGLIDLAHPYGLDGYYADLTGYQAPTAFAKLAALVAKGPVIVSVYYQFNPKSPIPHLIVVNDIEGDTVYYNDPATTKGTKHTDTATFRMAWKKKAIVIGPAATTTLAVSR